jgi:hypothetical protein
MQMSHQSRRQSGVTTTYWLLRLRLLLRLLWRQQQLVIRLRVCENGDDPGACASRNTSGQEPHRVRISISSRLFYGIALDPGLCCSALLDICLPISLIMSQQEETNTETVQEGK